MKIQRIDIGLNFNTAASLIKESSRHICQCLVQLHLPAVGQWQSIWVTQD